MIVVLFSKTDNSSISFRVKYNGFRLCHSEFEESVEDPSDYGGVGVLVKGRATNMVGS